MTTYTHLLKVNAFILIASLSLYSCKERGCNDKNALNYDITATENDGSCRYCASNSEYMGSSSAILRDNNFSSPYYQDNIIDFYFNQFSTSYNDAKCGITGCLLSVDVHNKLNETVTFDFRVTSSSGSVSFRSDSTITLQPFENRKIGYISEADLDFSTSSFCNPVSSLFLQATINFRSIQYGN